MVLLPDGLTPEVAAFARMLNVTLTTLKTTAARPADKVMVMGLGLVGHLAAKNFMRCGYQVMGVDPDPGRRQLARQSGVHAVYPTTPLDDPQIAKQVALVLECSGHDIWRTTLRSTLLFVQWWLSQALYATADKLAQL
jgi:threonine dehydrogenase-like Zn-dependent dehydrogenase